MLPGGPDGCSQAGQSCCKAWLKVQDPWIQAGMGRHGPTFSGVQQGHGSGGVDIHARAHGALSVHATIGEEQQEEAHDGEDCGDEQDAMHAYGAAQAAFLWGFQQGLGRRHDSCTQ